MRPVWGDMALLPVKRWLLWCGPSLCPFTALVGFWGPCLPDICLLDLEGRNNDYISLSVYSHNCHGRNTACEVALWAAQSCFRWRNRMAKSVNDHEENCTLSLINSKANPFQRSHMRSKCILKWISQTTAHKACSSVQILAPLEASN